MCHFVSKQGAFKVIMQSCCNIPDRQCLLNYPKIIVRRASFVFAVALSESETCIAGGASIGLFSRRARISLSRDFRVFIKPHGINLRFAAVLQSFFRIAILCTTQCFADLFKRDRLSRNRCRHNSPPFKLSPGVINSFYLTHGRCLFSSKMASTESKQCVYCYFSHLFYRHGYFLNQPGFLMIFPG